MRKNPALRVEGGISQSKPSMPGKVVDDRLDPLAKVFVLKEEWVMRNGRIREPH